MRKLLLSSFALMLLFSCTKEVEIQDSSVPLTRSGKQTLTLTFSACNYQPGLWNYGLQFCCSTPGVSQVDLNVHNVWMCWQPSNVTSPVFCAYGISVQMFGNQYSEQVPGAVDYRSFVDLGSIRVNNASIEATAEQYDFNVNGISSGYYAGGPPVGPGGDGDGSGGADPMCARCFRPLNGTACVCDSTRIHW